MNTIFSDSQNVKKDRKKVKQTVERLNLLLSSMLKWKCHTIMPFLAFNWNAWLLTWAIT